MGNHGQYVELDNLNEHWVRFSEVGFGIALVKCWPDLWRKLLEVEHGLAAHQHDVGYVGEYPFNPAIPKGVRVLLHPFPHDHDKHTWLCP